MCTLDESNEAYRYIGLPGYNPHIKAEVFYKYYEQVENADIMISRSRTDHEKTMLINSRRIFNIAEKGKTYEEREDLARIYFDQVHASDASEEEYQSGKTMIQIYIMGVNAEGTTVYSFRPIRRNSYLHHKLCKNGCLEGTFNDLKKRIDWIYLHTKTDKKYLSFLCAPSFYRKERRDSLCANAAISNVPIYSPEMNYNWAYWPDLS